MARSGWSPTKHHRGTDSFRASVVAWLCLALDRPKPHQSWRLPLELLYLAIEFAWDPKYDAQQCVASHHPFLLFYHEVYADGRDAAGSFTSTERTFGLVGRVMDSFPTVMQEYYPESRPHVAQFFERNREAFRGRAQPNFCGLFEPMAPVHARARVAYTLLLQETFSRIAPAIARVTGIGTVTQNDALIGCLLHDLATDGGRLCVPQVTGLRNKMQLAQLIPTRDSFTLRLRAGHFYIYDVINAFYSQAHFSSLGVKVSAEPNEHTEGYYDRAGTYIDIPMENLDNLVDVIAQTPLYMERVAAFNQACLEDESVRLSLKDTVIVRAPR